MSGHGDLRPYARPERGLQWMYKKDDTSTMEGAFDGKSGVPLRL